MRSRKYKNATPLRSPMLGMRCDDVITPPGFAKMTVTDSAIIILALTTFGSKIADIYMDRKRARDIAHIKKVGDETHKLSNSAMSAQVKATALALKMYYLALKRIAEMTKESADIDASTAALNAWVAAEKMIGRYESRQVKADISDVPISEAEL